MKFRIPLAWLQLRHQKARFLVALSGVIFSVLLSFMQFAIRDALFDSAVILHNSLQGECFLISPRSTAYIAMESFTEHRLAQALAFEEVELVSGVYLGFAQWKNPETRDSWRNLFVIGIDMRHQILNLSGVAENRKKLQMPDVVLFDQSSRPEFGPIVSEFKQEGTVTTEVVVGGETRKVTVVGLFELGTSFGADGNLATSHLNFLRMFNKRPKGFIEIGVIQLKPGTDAEKFTQKLREYLPKDVTVLTKEGLIRFEKSYWQSGAIGFIFTGGVLLGSIVGIVVVYQILYTNVSEHLSEYATLKAMGYRNKYLVNFVAQQALILAILGYIPGVLLSIILSEYVKKATLLPLSMNFNRLIVVFLFTLFICFFAGVTAMKKLKDADPADIF